MSQLPDVCPECDDSPLSVASNILGILTFGLGLLISVAAFIAITRSADTGIASSKATLHQTNQHIRQIDSYLDILELRSDPELELMDQLIRESLGAFYEAQDEIENYLACFVVPCSLWTRCRWRYQEKETAAAMAKLESHRQHFSAIQQTFLLRYVNEAIVIMMASFV